MRAGHGEKDRSIEGVLHTLHRGLTPTGKVAGISKEVMPMAQMLSNAALVLWAIVVLRVLTLIAKTAK